MIANYKRSTTLKAQSNYDAVHFVVVVNLTRSMAMELAPDVRVNALCPGVIETDMTRVGFAVNGDQDEGIRRQHSAYPLKRIGLLEEAAAATLFLASNEAGFINGAALPMEGGATVGKWE